VPGVRLQRYLARAGVASRRSSEALIQSGRVAVNGTPVTAMGVKVTDSDTVTVDGNVVRPSTVLHYLALHKPVRVICTQADQAARTRAVEFIPERFRKGLFHVGRLDYMSSGLIFFTNDGEFARIVTHPSFEVEKEYRLECKEAIPDNMLEAYTRGIRLDDDFLRILGFKRERADAVRLVLG